MIDSEIIAAIQRKRGRDTYGLPDYGLGPMTADTRAGNPNAVAQQWNPTPGDDEALRWRQQYGRAGERGAPIAKALVDNGGLPGTLASGVLEQPMATGKAVGEAIDDPSLANVTNAGVQSALMAGAPVHGAGIAGLGYATAGGLDLASQFASPAQAETDIKGLGPRARKQALEAETARALELEKLRIGAQAEESKRAESERAVTARKDQIAAAKKELIRQLTEARVPPKDETFSGQMYEKIGGLTPLLGAAGMGALSHAATKVIGASKLLPEAASTGSKIAAKGFDDYIVPALVGTETGWSLARAPDQAKLSRADTSNPEHRAWQQYQLALPEDATSERAMAAERLTGPNAVPREDPEVTRARERLGDWKLQAQQALTGTLGGLSGKVLGAASEYSPQIARGAGLLPGKMTAGIAEGFGEVPGALRAGATKGEMNAAIQSGKLQELRRAAAETEQGIAEAQNRSGGQGGVQSGSQVASEASPPSPVSEPVGPASTSSAPANQITNGAPAAAGNQVTIGVDPEFKAALLNALQKPSTGGSGAPRSMPPPASTGPGRWIDEIQPTAREALKAHLEGGGSLAKGNAAKLTRDINAGLPPATKEISDAEVRKRVGNMRDAYGDRPNLAQFESDVPMGSDLLKGKRMFSVAAPAAAAIGASDGTDLDPRVIAQRLLLQQQGVR